ncbi:MAG: PilT/PilU family type 4a pilus ATPase [Candidatus Omnitrophota bacterium]
MAEFEIKELLHLMVEKQASDLHLGVDRRPTLRIDEKLFPVDWPVLQSNDVKNLIYSILTPEEINTFEQEKEMDKSFEIEKLSRYRINLFYQRGFVGAAIRAISLKIRSLSECGLPERIVLNLCRRSRGLVLITGAAGSGKSTTLASIIERINIESNCHIVTVEDPIEFIYENKRAIIDQREIGSDSHSFSTALKYVLRQDPDVILVGEMRDLETIEEALMIAETGHLVLATLHTSETVQTINRIIDVFPSSQQQQVRTQLSFVLLGTISQQLIPSFKKQGRVLASEIMVVNPAIRSLIREQKVHQIFSVLQTSQHDSGMQTMNQSLYHLYHTKKISFEEAIGRSTDTEELLRLIKRY